MANYDENEPSELEIEEQRAGVQPEQHGGGDLFERAQASGWLGGLDDIGEGAPAAPTPGDVDDPDAERMAEHQLNATGRPAVRFSPQDLHQQDDAGTD